jgi:hypothetical protein
MNGNWIFWVIIFWWVIPLVMRKMRQPGQGPGRPPYPQDRRDQYGRDQYGWRPGQPGTPYPGQGQYPGSPQGQNPQGQNPQGQNPQGQLPEAQGAGGTPWWQQPLPPGFPGQPAPQAERVPQSQPVPQPPSGAQSQTAGQAPGASTAPAETGAPDDAPQGYRAKKLAELDRQFSEQKISLEEYMKARNEVMRG